MSWGELYPAGPGTPDPVTLRELTLGALAEAFITRRSRGSCADCAPGRRCPDCRQDYAMSCQYEAAYMRILGVGSDGAMLALTGGLTP